MALGRVTVLSALGEPLRAEIDIPEITADEAATLRAGVAAPDAFKAAEHSLVHTRNLGMRDKALEPLAEGGVLIAVGALHLPGKQGLVSLFREAGYTVTPIE